MPDLILDDKRKQQLDANLKKLVQAGATKDDVLKFASDFKTKFGVDRTAKQAATDKAMQEFPKLKEVAQTRFQQPSDIAGTIPSIGFQAQQKKEVQEAPERIRVREENIKKNKEIALNNNTKKVLESSGVKFTEGDAIYKKTRDSILNSVNDGNLVLSVDANNQPVYKRSLGIIESFVQGLESSRQEIVKAEEFRKADNATRIKMADEFLASQEQEGVPSGFMAEAAGFLGQTTPQIARAMIGGKIGAALSAPLPAQAKVITAAGSFLAMLPSIAEQSYRQSTIQSYSKAVDEAKRQKRINGQSDILTEKEKEDAMAKATAQGLIGAGAEALVVGGLSAIPVGGVIAGKSLQKAVKQFAKNTSIEAGRQTGLGTASELIKGAASSAAGYNTTFSETLDAALERFGTDAAAAVSFEVVFNASAFPKSVQSAAKNYLSTIPAPEFNRFMKDLEAKGVVPEGSTEKVMADIDAYNSAKQKVANIVPEEDMPSFAGLIEKKTNLENQKKTTDPTFHPKIDEQINAINERITKMQESKDPIVDEVDELTGDSGEPAPVTEEQILKTIEINQGEPVAAAIGPVPQEAMKLQEGVQYGERGMVKFAEGVEIPYRYKIIEAAELKPSHLPSGQRNPEHSIALAQPKERGDIQSKLAQEKISKAPNLGEVGESPNPYFGAPFINSRGEVIQGNNRSLGLKKHYEEGGTSYKSQLVENADKFGVTREQIEAMENPILVRESPIDDAMAIELGNYDVKDLETGGKQRIDPITTVRKMSPEDKNKLASIIFDRDYATVKEAIRDNQADVGSIISKQINAAQRNTIFDKEGGINQRGMDDIENIVNNMIFESGDAVLPEAFAELPFIQQKNIQKSIKNIFSIPDAKTILPEIQNAILGLYDFRKSGVTNFNAWLSTMDIFQGKTPRDIFNPLEIELMKVIDKAKNQSELSRKISEYADLVNDKAADMFEPARAGMTKVEAIKKQFNIDYENIPQRYAEPEGEVKPTEVVREQVEPTTEPTGEPVVARAEPAELDAYESYKSRKLADEQAFAAEYEQNRIAEQGETREQYLLRKYCQEG